MKFKKTIGILAVFSFISLAVLLTTCSNPFASNEEEGYFVIIIGASGNSRAALEYPPKGFPNAPDGALELKDLKFSVTFTPIPSGSPTTVEKQGTVDIRGTLTQGDYTVTTKVSLLDGTLYAQGCAIDNPVHINGGTNSITVWVYSVNDAAIPLIKARPQGGSYATGTAPKPLTVTASSIDGGVISYKWHSNTKPDEKGWSTIGENSASYTPPTATAGTTYYYVEVTNTKGGKTQTLTCGPAIVAVSADGATPAITAQPASNSILKGEKVTLAVAATVSNGGTLSYQWHANTKPTNSGGIPLGVSTASYITEPFDEPGTYYYYCVVTNTYSADGSTKTATVTSDVATITVSAIVDAETPKFTTQPPNPSILTNQTTNLTIVASVKDKGTLSYQWYSNTSDDNSGGSEINGATSTSYTTLPLANGTYYYYCVVTNTNLSVNGKKVVTAASDVSTVTVSEVINAQIPAINTHPQNASISPGATATLTIAASVTDGGTVTYQWYSNSSASNSGGSIISGATSTSYTTPPLSTGTSYYYCAVTNTNNKPAITGTTVETVESNVVAVTVIFNAQTPTITVPPTGTSIYAGQTATLSITATVTDGGTISYRWYGNSSASNSGGTPLDAHNDSYTTPPLNATGPHYYYCVVTNTNNSVNGTQEVSVASNAVTITVNPAITALAPTITSQPTGATYKQGDTPTNLTVSASSNDGGTLSYKWYDNGTTNSNTGGTLISGATSASYAPPTNVTGTFHYYCEVTNTIASNGDNGQKTATATSNAATVTVNAIVNAAPPSVGTPTVTPSSVTAGTAATLTVAATASDSGILSYQWYKNTSPTNSGGNAVTDGSGGTSASYTTPTTLTTGSHYYYCVVTNTNNSATGTKTATATSSVATVTVTPLVIPQTPNITTQPKDAYYKLPATPTALTVTASVTDGGTLTYQWFSNTTFSNAGGSSVSSSSTSPTFTPPTSSTSPKGTIYYYVVITNTLTGNTTSIRSSPVVVIMDNDSPYSDSAGSGTSGDPFKVYDVATLQKVGTGTDGWSLSVYYEQVRHINLSSVSNWTAIGTQSVKFIGNYDGGGYTISNLTINSTSAAFQGLFGHISDSSKVINVGLVNCNIKAYHRIGGVVGFNNGATVENCYTTGSVSGNIIIGGVVGYNVGSGANVKNCYSTANVKGTEGNTSVGGVVGSNEGAIENCYSRGTVSGVDQVGGVVGLNKGNVKNCYATSNVSGTGVYVGGVAGESSDFMENCYATGNVSGTIQVGGVVGVSRSTSAVLQNCYATGNVSGTRQVGGVIGYNNGNVKNCYATGNVSDTEEQFGGVAGCNPNLNTVQNSVALNPNISGPTSVGRVAYNTGTLKDNYGRSDMTKNNNAGGWTSNATGVDGANITSANWNLESWWTGVGFSTTYWDFSDISTARGPTLKNMPGGVQNPVIK